MIFKKIFNIKITNDTLRLILIALFISLTIGFFAPSHIFLTNQLEFSFIYEDALPYLFIITASLSILFFSILLTIKKYANKKYFKVALSLIFTLGVLFYIQGNIIVWDYGIFDGTPIEWSKYANRNYIDGLIWASLIIFAILKHNFILRIAKKIAEYFASLGKYLIIEFVPKEDSKVKKLLASREDIFPNYKQSEFEKVFTKYFKLIEKHKVKGSLRTLYYYRILFK